MNTVQIALKSIVIIAVVVLLLAILSIFVLSQAGQSGTSASYDRIFFAGCEQIQQRGCDWEQVQGDAEFLSACQHLYGNQYEAYSCVNRFCSSCSKFESKEQVLCGGWCDGVNGAISISSPYMNTICNSNIQCKSSCGVCSGY